MDNRILVKVYASKESISFRTITRTEKSPHRFILLRKELERLGGEGQIIAADLASFAVLRRDRLAGVMRIKFCWLERNEDGLFGREENVVLPYDAFTAFVNRSREQCGVCEWKVLSLREQNSPRLVFKSRQNLRRVLENKPVRRKLLRFLRDNFRWPGTSEIHFYDDFLAYSFFFREVSSDQSTMCGGLIFHGKSDVRDASYSLHT